MDEKKTKKKQDTKVLELEQRVVELEDQLLRSIADYRNLEKRFDEERREVIKYANKDLIEILLPAFDTLLLAGKYSEDQGVKLTVKLLEDKFAEIGVTRVETEGKDFDPTLMEVVDTVDGDPSTGSGQERYVVVEETRPGYLLNGKLLRPAQVKVGK